MCQILFLLAIIGYLVFKSWHSCGFCLLELASYTYMQKWWKKDEVDMFW